MLVLKSGPRSPAGSCPSWSTPTANWSRPIRSWRSSPRRQHGWCRGRGYPTSSSGPGLYVPCHARLCRGGVLGFRLPRIAIATEPASDVERSELASLGIQLAGSAMSVIRGSVGFLAFLLAFNLRRGEEGIDLHPLGAGAAAGAALVQRVPVRKIVGVPSAPTWHFGAVLLAAGLGGLARIRGLRLGCEPACSKNVFCKALWPLCSAQPFWLPGWRTVRSDGADARDRDRCRNRQAGLRLARAARCAGCELRPVVRPVRDEIPALLGDRCVAASGRLPARPPRLLPRCRRRGSRLRRLLHRPAIAIGSVALAAGETARSSYSGAGPRVHAVTGYDEQDPTTRFVDDETSVSYANQRTETFTIPPPSAVGSPANPDKAGRGPAPAQPAGGSPAWRTRRAPRRPRRKSTNDHPELF